MEALSSPYSEAELLAYLEKSATVIDSISHLTSRQAGFSELSEDEQRVIVNNLAIVSEALKYLGDRILPAFFIPSAAPSALSQAATAERLAHIRTQAVAIERHLQETAACLN